MAGITDVIRSVSKELGISYGRADILVNTVVNEIKKNITNEPLKIKNFGTFKLLKTMPRSYVNPQTMEPCICPERVKVTFHQSENYFQEVFDDSTRRVDS